MTAFDGLVLVAILVSGLLALARGFVREAASILEIVGAALGALWLFMLLREGARDAIQDNWITDFVLIAALFVIVYVALRILLGKLSVYLTDRYSPTADRALGFGFGALRGVLLVGLVYLSYSYLQDQSRQPDWVRSGATYPMVRSLSEFLGQFAPEPDQTETKESSLPPKADEASPNATARTGGNEGYASGDRDSLEQILTTTTTTESE
ncbi:MAG: CvpA family protein [Pseudomonadota bacterium]